LPAGPHLYTLDGQARSEADLVDALSKVVKERPMTVVLLRVADAVPFERVRRAASAVRSAGIHFVRLAPADRGGDSD
jgi:biopolymer transport protein ExbD